MPTSVSLPLSLIPCSSPFIISTDSSTTSMISGVIFSSFRRALFSTSSIWCVSLVRISKFKKLDDPFTVCATRKILFKSSKSSGFDSSSIRSWSICSTSSKASTRKSSIISLISSMIFPLISCALRSREALRYKIAMRQIWLDMLRLRPLCFELRYSRCLKKS